MQRLPDPPAQFPVPADIKPLRTGTLVWRVYSQGGPHPVTWDEFRHFGPTSSRFDHHTRPRRANQGRGILYATVGGDAVLAALAEVFQATRHIDRKHRDPWLVAFELEADLELLDLTGLWPVSAGGGMSIHSGSRAQARKWSKRIYEEYTSAQGVYFPSSLTGEPCLALYERSKPAMPKAPKLNRALSDPSLFAPLTNVAARLNFTLK